MKEADVYDFLGWILCAKFKGREIIEEQIRNSTFTIDEREYYAFVMFEKVKDGTKFPYRVRVPVDMLIYENGTIVPIVFMLHVMEGWIHELEIFRADSSELNLKGLKDLDIRKIEYVVDEYEET